MRSDRRNGFPWWLLGIAIGCSVPNLVLWWTTGSLLFLFTFALLVVVFALVLRKVTPARVRNKGGEPVTGDFASALDLLDALIA